MPRHTLDSWLIRTLAVQPGENRIEAEEFHEELTCHGLRPTVAPDHHFAGHAFAGAVPQGSMTGGPRRLGAVSEMTVAFVDLAGFVALTELRRTARSRPPI